MASETLKEYLDQHHVNYECLPHTPTITAQETAEQAHISGKHLAKTVVLKIDGELTLCVIPADQHVNIHYLQDELGNDREIEIASENDFRDAFPDCELGAMPPIGELFDVDVLIDDLLAEDDEIVFNAGSHSELVRMRYQDYEDLVHPRHVCATD